MIAASCCARVWTRVVLLALVAGLLAATPLPGAAATAAAPADASAVAAAPPEACPEVMPVADVRPGMTGVGYTVAKGQTVEPFDVEVIDVLRNALANGRHLIIVEAVSPAIQGAGGIWAGMSGSPVYIGGKLVGAVGYGFSGSDESVGGVTPAEYMYDVVGAGRAAVMADEVALPPSTQRRITAATGHSTPVSMSSLPVPMSINGLRGQRLARLNASMQRAGWNAFLPSPLSGGADGDGVGFDPSAVADITPGSNFAAALSFGEVTFAGTGTTTAVCDGKVLAFGHPFGWWGETALSAHTASAVRVIRDRTWGPYKLANVGAAVGTVDQDRLAAIGGSLGSAPRTIPVRSTITNASAGTPARTATTQVVMPDFLGMLTLFHLWSAYDSHAHDTLLYSGTTEVGWTIRGTRADGSPWALQRRNRHADDVDLSTASAFEAMLTIDQLRHNGLEDVRITSVDYKATSRKQFEQLQIMRKEVTYSVDGGRWRPLGRQIRLVPGTTITLRVPLRPHNGGTTRRVEQLRLAIPRDAAGYGSLQIGSGGQFGDAFECGWDPESCGAGDDSAGTFDELLTELRTRPRNDALVATVVKTGSAEVDEGPGFVAPGHGGGGEEGPTEVATASRVLDQVVVGRVSSSAEIGFQRACGGERLEPMYFDLDRNPHASRIACADMLGIMRGSQGEMPSFRPAAAVTRAEAATILARTLEVSGHRLPVTTRHAFADVPKGSRHADAINRLAAAGIVTGDSSGRYHPTRTLTRGATATMVMRASRWGLERPLRTTRGPLFTDTAGKANAANIDAAREYRVMYGYPDGTFRPTNNIRRDDTAATMIYVHELLLNDGRRPR